MAHTSKHTIFPANPTGRHLANLFIASSVFCTLSVALSLVCFGYLSLFIIPSAFFVTVVHHTVIRYLLAKRTPTATAKLNSPSEARFRCLWRPANFWTMLAFALVWLAGAVYTFVVYGLSGVNQETPVYTFTNLTSAAFAVIESALLIAIAVLSRALMREAALERTRLVSSEGVSVV